MKNMRSLVVGIALVLPVLVVSAAFAQRLGTLDGVSWATIEGRSSRLANQDARFYTEVYNENSYAVRIDLKTLSGTIMHQNIDFSTGETKHFSGSLKVSSVKRR